MTSRRPLQNIRQGEFVGLRTSMTLEEVDCERRGYRLTKTVLGTGAYAKVKLAYVMENKLEKDQKLAAVLNEKGHTMVAIKLVCKKKAPPDYLTKFMPREIDSLNATCRHHNVIQLYETFHTESKVYLVMEYASRGDLLDFINSRSRRGIGIGEELTKHLFKQLAEGVAHCHRRNVVHRDLKCENILLDQDHIVKVSDFGFATRYPTNKCKLLSTFCGSYAYAAPEILQAQKYDGKCADVWSMGIILFAMMCGRLPFNDNSLNSLIQQIKGKLAFPPRSSCPIECQHLIRQALTCEPLKRIKMSEILVHSWLISGPCKTFAVSKVDKRPVTHAIQKESAIQKEIEQSRDEKKVSSPATPATLKRTEPNVTARTPVPKQGWASSGNTPEPHTTAKLLHRKDYRLSSISPAVDSLLREDTPTSTDATRSTTPCPRSFTPTSQPKMPQKRELAVKIAQILTDTGFQAKPSNLSRETYVVMNRALQMSQRSGQTRNDIRDSTQRVWKYVTNLSSTGRTSVTPAVPDSTSSSRPKDVQSPASTNLPPVSLWLNDLAPNPPASEKPVKTTSPWRPVNLYSKQRTGSLPGEATHSKATAPVQTRKRSVQESSPGKEKQTESQPTQSCKPLLLNIDLQTPKATKAKAFPSSPQSPESSQTETQSGAGKHRFVRRKSKGRSHAVSIKDSNLRTALRRSSVSHEQTGERKRVHFEPDQQQT